MFCCGYHNVGKPANFGIIFPKILSTARSITWYKFYEHNRQEPNYNGSFFFDASNVKRDFWMLRKRDNYDDNMREISLKGDTRLATEFYPWTGRIARATIQLGSNNSLFYLGFNQKRNGECYQKSFTSKVANTSSFLIYNYC